MVVAAAAAVAAASSTKTSTVVAVEGGGGAAAGEDAEVEVEVEVVEASTTRTSECLFPFSCPASLLKPLAKLGCWYLRSRSMSCDVHSLDLQSCE